MMRKYFWKCEWTNDKGAFHPDLECCHSKGRAVFKTALAAAQAGEKHNQTHGWCGWGYPPPGWQNKTVLVGYKTPTGKVKYIGYSTDILEKA